MGTQMGFRGFCLIPGLVIALSGVAAMAADSAWTGSTDALWATTTNWNPGTPASGDIAVFDGAGGGNTTIDLGGGATAGGLRFTSASAAAYTLGSAGQSLAFSVPGDTVTVAADLTTAQTLAADVVLGAAGTFTVRNDGGGSLSLAGPITGSSAGTAVLAVAGTGNATLSGAITTAGGNVSLSKDGAGTLALSGGGTFAGGGVVDPSSFAASVVLREGTTVVSGSAYDASGTNLVVGSFATAGAEGANVSLQIDAGGVISGIDGFQIGRGNGTGTVSSDVVLNGDAAISAVSGIFGFNGGSTLNQPRTSLVLNDSSSLTLSGTNLLMGRSAGSASTMTVNDSALVDMTYVVTSSEDGGGFTVGRSGGSGSLLVNGGTVRATWVDVGRGDNNSQTSLGDITVTNGGLLSSQGNVRLGFAGNASTQASITVDGGTLSIGTTSERWMILGRYDATNSTVTVQNGGRIDLNGGSDLRFTQNNNTGTNVFTLTDGTITGYSDEGQTVGGDTVVDLNRGSSASGTNNTFNLDGGTLTVRRVITANNTGRARFNFNGGLLQSNGETAALVDLGGANQLVNVRDGGARIDTNGFDVTLPEALRHSDIGGDAAIDGGLTKSGVGTLTLSGASTYTGPTVVNAGTLVVTGSLSATSGVSLASGAAIGGAGSIAGDLQFGSGAQLAFDPVNPLTISGTVTFASPATFGIDDILGVSSGTPLGTYTLIAGTVDTTGLANLGAANAYDLGSGISAFFQSGSLQMVVVPEPAVVSLLGFAVGAGVLMRRRRRG